MGEMGGLNVREGERERESAHNTNRSMSSLSSMYGFFFTRLTSSWAMSLGKGGDGWEGGWWRGQEGAVQHGQLTQEKAQQLLGVLLRTALERLVGAT